MTGTGFDSRQAVLAGSILGLASTLLFMYIKCQEAFVLPPGPVAAKRVPPVHCRFLFSGTACGETFGADINIK